MYNDHNQHYWPTFNSVTKRVDDLIERNIALNDVLFQPVHRDNLLPSDVLTMSYKHWPISTRYSSFNDYRPYKSQYILPRPISPVEFPRITLDRYPHRPFYCRRCHHYDFSHLYLNNREPSFFPLAQNFYRLQTDYDLFHARKRRHYFPRGHFKRRWKAVGLVLIFYFMLKKNVRQAKKADTYYQRDYRRLRFLELLTAVHRVYLEPNSSIHKALSRATHSSTDYLSRETLFACVRSIVSHLTDFLPTTGILGTSSDESVLIYLLRCPFDQYPSTYFWSIERHLLSISKQNMQEQGRSEPDHFTTKFLIISTFIFRCLIKTLLLKPVKYRLARGTLDRKQWYNTRLLSTLILYCARHAVLYKKRKNSLPMPFPFEMKEYLIDDERIQRMFHGLDQLADHTAAKLSSWACDYAENLQRHMATMKK